MDLRDRNLGVIGTEALIGLTLPKLESLNLSRNYIGAEGAIALS